MSQSQSKKEYKIPVKIVYQNIQIKFTFESFKTISELINLAIEKFDKKNVHLDHDTIALYDVDDFELDESEVVEDLIEKDQVLYIKPQVQLKNKHSSSDSQDDSIEVEDEGLSWNTQSDESNQQNNNPLQKQKSNKVNSPVHKAKAQSNQQPIIANQQNIAIPNEEPLDLLNFLILPTVPQNNLKPQQEQQQQQQQQQAIMIEEEEEKLPENIITLYLKFPQFPEPQRQHKINFNKKLTFSDLSDEVVNLMKIKQIAENICFFNEEGLPFANSLQSYGEMICEQELSHQDVLYCICTNTQKQNTQKFSDPDIGPDQIFVKYTRTYVINLDLKQDSVLILKQKINSKLQLNSSKIYLVSQGKHLKDNQQLSDYNIQSNNTIEVFMKMDQVIETSNDLYSPNLVHARTVTEIGVRQLRCHLTVLRENLSQDQQTCLLGLLRDLSENNLPMILGLKSLFSKVTMSLAFKIAIEEGLYVVFAKLLCSAPQKSCNGLNISNQKIFEHSRSCLSLMVKYISSLNAVPNVWSKREQFQITDNKCFYSLMKLQGEAVFLTKDDNKTVICNKAYMLEKIEQKQNVGGVQSLTEDKLKSDPKLPQLIKILNRIADNNIIYRWQPDPQFALFQPSLDCEKCKFELDWQKKIPEYWDNDYHFKVYNPIALKQNPPYPCLTINDKKELIVYRGVNKDPTKPIWILDLMTGKEEAANPDILAGLAAASASSGLNQYAIQNLLSQLKNRGNGLSNTLTQAMINSQLQKLRLKLSPPTITQEPKEAIVVVLDISGSMSEKFADGLTRMGAVQAFFSAFADRTMAYKFQHVIQLIFFDTKVEVQCDFTELFLQFKELINTAQPRERTSLYDALAKAAENLLILRKKYPAVIPRIIALTDGEDNESNISLADTARKIIGNQIVLDSFVVGGECDELKSLTLVSGGKCFYPQSLAEGIKLFEVETILSSGIRKKPDLALDINLDLIEEQLDGNIDADFSKEGHDIQLPQNITKPVVEFVEPKQILENQALNINPSQRMKRIMKELTNLIQNPHPNIKVLPVQDDISFWKILLIGPEGTPYENGTFILYLSFPENYPNEPPKIRFLTQVYHCNINSLGRICHSVLDRNYLVDTTVKQIFDCIFGLLMTPEPEDPLDSTIASEYMTDLITYQHKAKQLTQQKAMPTEENFIKEIFGNNLEEGEKYKKQIIDWLTEVKNKKQDKQ